MNLKLGQKLTIEVLRLGIYGEGVSSLQGFTLFVQGALPKEIVETEVIELKKNYGRLKLLSILKPSKDRVIPPCPVFGKCGGCQLQHLDYQAQLESKQQKVKDALERIGKIFVPVLPTVPSLNPFHYRNKIQMPSKQGRLGLFAMNSHDLVEVKECLIHCDLGEKVLNRLRQIKIPFLKYLILKTAKKTEQVLVVLVVEKDLPLSLGDQILSLMPEIKGVIQNLNPNPGNVILGKDFKTLAGLSYIEDEICSLRFKVSAASFFQVNPAQAENLYQAAINGLNLKGNETVLDAYCGVGTLSLIASKHAADVIGVECVPQAIENANENKKVNEIDNVTFHTDYAENFIQKLDHIDAVLLNPPRKGCDLSLLEKLIRLAPPKLVYISCDPATLARDLKVLSDTYEVIKVQPFDMFPQTNHVETLAILELKI